MNTTLTIALAVPNFLVALATLWLLLKKSAGAKEERVIINNPLITAKQPEYVTKEAFEKYQREREKSQKESEERLTKDLQEIKSLLVDEIKSGKEDRRQIYNRLGRCEQGHSFIAGRLEGKGDADGHRLRSIINSHE